MELHITCIPGDGIGPEIVRETKKVLDKVAHKYGHKMIYKDILMGGASIDVHGVPLTEEAIAYAKAADAVLMGSIGGNTTTSPWYKLPPEKRPEAGLLAMRKALNLFANLRPAVLYDELAAACPLKEEISKAGFDMLIMRELTGGLKWGEKDPPSPELRVLRSKAGKYKEWFYIGPRPCPPARPPPGEADKPFPQKYEGWRWPSCRSSADGPSCTA